MRTNQYVGILDGADDCWGVRIPDLPGCHGGGTTAEAAIADATSAAREWAMHQIAKGRSFNPPRSIADVVADTDSDYGRNGPEVAVMIPLVLEHGRSIRANLSLDAGLLAAIDAEADRLGLTRSAFMAEAAREKLGAA